MSVSNAVRIDRVSSTVGIKISASDAKVVEDNLPLHIAVIGEANEAQQATLDLNEWTPTSIDDAGQKYGYGSPIWQALNILSPVYGGGVPLGRIRVYPVAKASGATAKTLTVTVTCPSGSATKSYTHGLLINGVRTVRGTSSTYSIAKGDTPTQIASKIATSLSNVLGSPVTATSALGVVTLVTKYAGLTADSTNVTIDVNGDSAGVDYAIASTVSGSGTPSIASALNKIGNQWIPLIVSCFGAEVSILDAFEQYIGFPDKTSPTGRYQGENFKPAIAFTGSTLDDPSTITDSRKTQCANKIACLPNQKYAPACIAANNAMSWFNLFTATPHLDLLGTSVGSQFPAVYPIGTMGDYDSRDTIVKKGASSVEVVAEEFRYVDEVTTYHPVGDATPTYRFVRNMLVYFNMAYRKIMLDKAVVVGSVITSDDSFTEASGVITPNMYKGEVIAFLKKAERDAFLVSVDTNTIPTMQIEVAGGTNPDRFDTYMDLTITGVGRIASTNLVFNFNFGNA